jgi:hypothetical protein
MDSCFNNLLSAFTIDHVTFFSLFQEKLIERRVLLLEILKIVLDLIELS